MVDKTTCLNFVKERYKDLLPEDLEVFTRMVKELSDKYEGTSELGQKQKELIDEIETAANMYLYGQTRDPIIKIKQREHYRRFGNDPDEGIVSILEGSNLIVEGSKDSAQVRAETLYDTNFHNTIVDFEENGIYEFVMHKEKEQDIHQVLSEIGNPNRKKHEDPKVEAAAKIYKKLGDII